MGGGRSTRRTAPRAATSGEDWPRSDWAIASPIMPVRPTMTAMGRVAVAAWAGGGSAAGGGNVARAPAAPVNRNPRIQPKSSQLAAGKLPRIAKPAYAMLVAAMMARPRLAGAAAATGERSPSSISPQIIHTRAMPPPPPPTPLSNPAGGPGPPTKNPRAEQEG